MVRLWLCRQCRRSPPPERGAIGYFAGGEGGSLPLKGGGLGWGGQFSGLKRSNLTREVRPPPGSLRLPTSPFQREVEGAPVVKCEALLLSGRKHPRDMHIAEADLRRKPGCLLDMMSGI